MKVKLEVELQPFTVPNFVLLSKLPPKAREAGIDKPTSFHLSELDAEMLDRLCWEFRVAVFEKAGKRMPPTAA